MSGLTTEQHVATQKASVDTSFALLNKAFEGIDRLAELNVQAVKSVLAENQEFVIKVLSAKDPQETFSQQSIVAQPGAEKVQSYWRDVYEILSKTQAEFSALAQAQLRSFIDGLTKNAPPGSEAAVTAWTTFVTSATDTANSMYETAAKAARQAVETAESNLNAASTGKPSQQTLKPVAPIDKE
ncbi:phasin family protein [Paraburkholderia sp. JHI2823]|uniref:phasin family protein n=1 Tax=Paraburkholderia sp. JHI2823 TaxID=3112960 RepID=UPI00317D2D3F